jgi:hypothetical protein
VPALAITGEIGRPGGIAWEKPAVMTPFGYAEQPNAGRPTGIPLPAIVRDKDGARLSAMLELVALKGPSVVGELGTVSVPPEAGTGFGTLPVFESAPVGMDAGVAPVAEIVAFTVLVIEVTPSEEASERIAEGVGTSICNPLRLKVCPAEGDATERDPLTTASLNTRLPIGVLAQKSSNGGVSARAGPLRSCWLATTLIVEPVRSTANPAMPKREKTFGTPLIRNPPVRRCRPGWDRPEVASRPDPSSDTLRRTQMMHNRKNSRQGGKKGTARAVHDERRPFSRAVAASEPRARSRRGGD